MRSISWKVFEAHTEGACPGRQQARRCGYAKVIQLKVSLRRRLALVDFLGPLLERHLNSKRLVDCEGDIENQAIDA
jgi:hypothetical protein